MRWEYNEKYTKTNKLHKKLKLIDNIFCLLKQLYINEAELDDDDGEIKSKNENDYNQNIRYLWSSTHLRFQIPYIILQLFNYFVSLK